MAAANRVFIARLAGLPVIDPNGDQVGRVRDVVIRERPPERPPVVLGLVVEIQHRRRIFVPIGRMLSLDAEAIVLSTGTLNLRRFEQRAGELLVLGELLDRRITVGAEQTTATVMDVAMEQIRTRDWEISRIAVREHGRPRLPGRRGHLRQVDWSEATGLARPLGEQGAEHLLAALGTMPPADLATLMLDLPPQRRQEVAAALDDDRLADVLQELPEEEQIEIITRLDEERVADVLEEMDPDDAADLLAELPPEEQERLLMLMTPAEAAPVRRLMNYAEGTAGSLMTSEPVILGPDATIAEALARIRDAKLTPALASQVYVCRPPAATPTGRYLGIAHFQRLLREPPSDLLGAVTDDGIDPLRTDSPITAVTRHLATYNLTACPVVDETDRLVGAVTVDDILDALLPEDWRETGRD
ncbi:MAG: CBS domain-containing protein [Actinobacteria bacterium]|nr:CBS domain-containing protein [Actinomycetota bacterium]MBI3687963.1 CBS domain-containing protein [Actinomycetota bacterium]